MKINQHVTKTEFRRYSRAASLRFDTVEKRLDNMVTKDEFNKLVLKVLEMDQRLRRVEETMATKDDVLKILNAIDAFTHRIETYDRKAVVHDARLNELEPALKDHETRITRLETFIPRP